MKSISVVSRDVIGGVLDLRLGYFIGLIAVVEGALALIAFPVHPSRDVQDYYGYGFAFADLYDKVGLMLSQGRGYRFLPETGLTLMREPGYPLLLAGIFSIFGRGLAAVRAVNVICTALSAWVLSILVAKVSASKLAPRVAILLFLMSPGVFVTELRGGVECVYTLLVLLFILVLHRAVAATTLTAYLLAGLLLGLVSVFRSTVLLFPAFLPLFFIFGETPRPSFSMMVRRLLVIAAGAGLVLSPWMIRNFMLVGVPIPTASVQSVAAHAGQYICKNRTLASNFQALDRAAAAERATLAEQQGYSFESGYYILFYDPRDEVNFNGWLGKRVVDEYRRSPSLLGRCVLENAFNFWFEGDNWRSTTLNILAQLPYLVIGTLGGIVYMRRRGWRNIGLLVLFCCYAMSVYLPIHAQARYSVPLIPFLSLFAAVGAAEVVSARGIRRREQQAT